MPLMLSRREGQSIDVDGPCRIEIERISPRLVRIAVHAPDSTRVMRTELIEDEEPEEIVVCNSD